MDILLFLQPLDCHTTWQHLGIAGRPGCVTFRQSIESAAHLRRFAGRTDSRPCARSMARKLGSPIIPWPLPNLATRVPAQLRILVSRLGSARSALEFPHGVSGVVQGVLRHLHFTRMAPECFPAATFCKQGSARCVVAVRDKTQPHSVRYAPVIGSAFGTSPMFALYVASWRNTAMPRNFSQDGVGLALTTFLHLAEVSCGVFRSVTCAGMRGPSVQQPPS